MQQKHALWFTVLAAWLYPKDAPAQFGQNAQLPNNVPPNIRLLPRVGNPPANSKQFYPFGYGSPLNNNFQNFGGPSAFGGNPYANSAFNNFGPPFGGGGGYNGFGYGGFGNGGFGNGGFGNGGFGGYGNGFGGGGFGGNGFGYNSGYGGFGYNNMLGPGPPFGGYQFGGYGNYSPIVGWNNGWYPYEPAYNPNSPVNQYMQQLFLQGLPNLNNMPNGNGKILPRGP